MTIAMNKNDGDLKVLDNHDNAEDFDILTDAQALKLIGTAPTWDWYDFSVWQALASNVGIDANSYDDPDDLYDALMEAQ